MDALAAALADHKRRGIQPKYIYTILTVQNPTGSILPVSRREEMLKLSLEYGAPIFEDDCYADLIWSGERPPAIYAMSRHGGVIHIGSFSIDRAGAAGRLHRRARTMMSRMLALKTDAGSGALEQMVLAEYCVSHFATHVPKLTRGLRAKLDTLMEALNEQFGTTAEFEGQGRHLPVGQAARQCRHAKALSGRTRRRRVHQPGAGMVDQQGPFRQPVAAVLCQPLA
jgi:2-aminoadipate transaminase